MSSQPLPHLPEALQLPLKIPIHWDPVPPWILHLMDKTILKELATLQIETQKAVLDIQLKGLDKTLAILKKF